MHDASAFCFFLHLNGLPMDCAYSTPDANAVLGGVWGSQGCFVVASCHEQAPSVKPA